MREHCRLISARLGSPIMAQDFPQEDMKAEFGWSGVPVGGVTVPLAAAATLEDLCKAQSPVLRLYDRFTATPENALSMHTPQRYAANFRLLLGCASLFLGGDSPTTQGYRRDYGYLLLDDPEGVLRFFHELRLAHLLRPIADRSSVRLKAYEDVVLFIVGHQQKTKRAAFSALRKADIAFIEIKGYDLFSVYGNVFPRRFNDIDILIRRSSIDRTKHALNCCGLHQGYDEIPSEGGAPTLKPLKPVSEDWVEHNHHELHPFYQFVDVTDEFDVDMDIARWFPILEESGGRLYLSVKLDVHFNLAYDFAETDLWHWAAGSRRDMLSPETYYFFYAARAYYETLVCGSNDVRSLVDGACIALRAGVDWQRLAHLRDTYESCAALYYVSRSINSLFGAVIPDDFVADCERRLVENPQFDLGDFMPRFLRSTQAPTL